MNPASPPLPTPWNLPFQLASGNHTSIFMSESPDGLNVAVTLQNAGSCVKSAVGGAPGRPASGEVNAPAATDCASVIVVFGSERRSRLSQVAACESDNEKRTSNRLKLRF